ncbi:MAG: PHP domain-containing protein [Deltaproteobacteria bacterium]|nr:PHP domain-containing protein [Deltaproteobacteria bacterium]
MIDLHIHTNASSDGQHSPREIFEMAWAKGLQAIAFADHNSIDNVEAGFKLSAEFGIEFVSCLELNTFHNGLDLHLLAFFIDPRSTALHNWMAEIRRKKQEQAEKRLQKLNELGFIFNWDDLRRFSADRLPTGMSFLRAILSRKENLKDRRLKPYTDGNRSFSPYVSFYRDYLRGGKPAFVHMEDIYTIDAIRKIKELGGIPVLAHPSDTGEKNLRDLVENGLEGLEVYSPYHDLNEQKAFRDFAEEHNLLITAGSDFHGKIVKPDIDLGQVSGNHYELLLKMKEFRKGKE